MSGSGYCADGKRISGRCNGSQDCDDASDERACFEFVGHDMLQCGAAVETPASFCRWSTCGFETTPPLCDEALPERFSCADGRDVSDSVVCDRNADCPDETDERYCPR